MADRPSDPCHQQPSILYPLSSPGFPAPSPSFKASKGEQRRTFGLFSSPLFALRVLSTTCVAKNALLAPPDSNGTEFWCGTPRHHPICRMRRKENQTSPHAPRSTQYAPLSGCYLQIITLGPLCQFVFLPPEPFQFFGHDPVRPGLVRLKPFRSVVIDATTPAHLVQ